MPMTAPPEAPSTDDPVNFDDEGDAWLAYWEDTAVPELNALETNVNTKEASAVAASAAAVASGLIAQTAAAVAVAASTYMGTITTNLTPGVGVKNLTGISAGLAMVNTADWYLISASHPEDRLHGQMSAVNLGLGTATMTVPANGFSGSTARTDWILVHAALVPLFAGVAADLLLGTSAIVGLSPDAIYDALAEVTLTDAATIAVDMATVINGHVTLGGNRTLGNPTNPKPGQTGRIRVTEDGTGGRTLSFAGNWKREGGAASIDTTANHETLIEYDVITSTFIWYDISRNPT